MNIVEPEARGDGVVPQRIGGHRTRGELPSTSFILFRSSKKPCDP